MKNPHGRGSVKLHDCRMFIHVDTGAAVLCSSTGNKKDAIWLPLSQIQVEDDARPGDHFGWQDMTMPYWLAEEHELIDD